MKTKLLALIAAGAVSVSAGGYMFIAGKEGEVKQGDVHVAYPDPGTNGVPWTICWGSTRDVRPGMVLTERECTERLRQDVAVAEAAVQRCVKVPLSQPEYDAYVSFTFNVGGHAFCNSTLVRLLNSGFRTQACNQMHRWVYANNRRMRGLVTRRREEAQMCLKFNREYVYVPSN